MVWLISLPIWVLFCSTLLPKRAETPKRAKTYMVLCSLALIFVLGLRSIYTGSMDTYMYSLAFDLAKKYSLVEYLTAKDCFEGFFLLSEVGSHVYTWLVAHVFSHVQWFVFLSSAIIVCLTAKFISRHSEDATVSWIVFICLGSMTFAMNGMRQAIAMSICLLAYGYAKDKHLVRFLLTVALAVLFHKSAVIFALVYLMRGMRLNAKSFILLTAGITLFLAFADRLAFLYDSMTGEDYAAGESFDSGGVSTIIVYLLAIVCILVFCKRLREPQGLFPLSLILVGFSLYLGRFLSTQIYERISYFFAYFLMIGFPTVFRDMNKRFASLVRMGFLLVCVLLFAYRISTGSFANFTMFW